MFFPNDFSGLVHHVECSRPRPKTLCSDVLRFHVMRVDGFKPNLCSHLA